MTTMPTLGGAATPVLLGILAALTVFAAVAVAATIVVTNALKTLDDLVGGFGDDQDDDLGTGDVVKPVVDQAEDIIHDAYVCYLRDIVRAKKVMLAHDIDDRHVTAGELAELADVDFDAAAAALADFAQIRHDVEREVGFEN